MPDDALSESGADGVLTVELRGNAYIETLQAEITLRTGPSSDRARFRVRPRAGTTRLILTATVLKKDTRVFVQSLTLEVAVASDDAPSPRRGLRERAIGRPLDEASGRRADVTLVLEGDQIRLEPHHLTARWPFTDRTCLREIAEQPRAVLREIAFGVLDDGDVPVHQAKVTIPPADHEKG